MKEHDVDSTNSNEDVIDVGLYPASRSLLTAPVVDKANAEALDAELQRRCIEANILLTRKEGFDGPNKVPNWILDLPCTKDKRSITIRSIDHLVDILSTRFEDYQFLAKYEAIFSTGTGTIEASIRQLGLVFDMSSQISRRFDGEKVSSLSSQVSISIGPMSDTLTVLTSHQLGRYSPLSSSSSIIRRPSMTISGLKVTQPEQAIAILEKLSNAYFFEIDLKMGLPLALIKQRSPELRRAAPSRRRSNSLKFPRNEYAQAPMSLYWYARSANAMPLLQFLAYYQSVEYYFPMYSGREAQEKIKHIVKDPSFDPHSDSDIARLLTVIRINGNRGFGDEGEQLKATLQQCVNLRELKAYLIDDDERRKFFNGEKQVNQQLSKYKLTLGFAHKVVLCRTFIGY